MKNKGLLILLLIALMLVATTMVAWAKPGDKAVGQPDSTAVVEQGTDNQEAVTTDDGKAGKALGKVDKTKLTAEEKAVQRQRPVGERLTIKGKHLGWGDTPPVIKDGRTLIPVRAITEALGAEVVWDAVYKTVTINRDAITLVLTLDTKEVSITKDGVTTTQTLDVPSQLMNNRTFVPLRFISEALGEKVNYEAETGDIDIEADEGALEGGTTQTGNETGGTN